MSSEYSRRALQCQTWDAMPDMGCNAMPDMGCCDALPDAMRCPARCQACYAMPCQVPGMRCPARCQTIHFSGFEL